MSHFTKYGKRMRLMLLTAMFVASMVCLFAIPFVEKNLLNKSDKRGTVEIYNSLNNKMINLCKELLEK